MAPGSRQWWDASRWLPCDNLNLTTNLDTITFRNLLDLDSDGVYQIPMDAYRPFNLRLPRLRSDFDYGSRDDMASLFLQFRRA